MCKKMIYLVSFVLVLGLVLTSRANAADPSQVGWWKLDEPSGTIAYDSSGNGNDGTLQGDPQWVAGKIGGALEGDGSDDYVKVPHSDSLDLSDAVTVALWAYHTGSVTTALLTKGSGASAWNSSYGLVLGNENFVTTHGAAVVRAACFSGTNARFNGFNSNNPVPLEEWIHIAVTFDVSAEGNNMKMYFNGQLEAEKRSTEPLERNTFDLLIGADGHPAGSSRWWWQGMLDDVRIYSRALSEAEILAAMEGAEGFPYAFGLAPVDGAMLEATWANLSWHAGDFALSHDVYIGESFDDVNAGAEATFVGNQAATKLIVGFPGFPYPDGLVPGITYYWRIDEVNDTDPNSPWKGNIWSFTIPPKTAYWPDPADGAESVDPDVELSWTGGFGAKLHTVYFGEDFDDVNNDAAGLPQSETTYTPGPLKLAETYYWRVDEFDAIDTYKGNIWSFTTQGAVGNPNPSNGAVDVEQTPVLTWTPGVYAASHQLYFGTDKEAVKNADTSSPEYKGTGNLGSESYDPGKLSWYTTYYWHIDEVNNVNPDSPWTGNVWNFTTVNFIVIEDFEDYNDYPPDEIFSTWIDGYGVETNGSTAGYPEPDWNAGEHYIETTIVHGGSQSMPLFYDNNFKYSEAAMTLVSPRNWTEEGVGVLSLWFRGDTSNAVERMYVTLNGSAVVYHDNPNAAQIEAWTEWTINLQKFTAQGVNLANVNTIAIGFGDKNNLQAGGSGMVFFDDIRLYRPAQ